MRIAILGNGGHARVIADALWRQPWPKVCVENDDDVQPDDMVFIGVGDLPLRRKLFDKFRGRVCSVLHERAHIGSTARLGDGYQVLAFALIAPSAVLGENVLVNTGAQVDHDCIIGAHSHIAPGAILCGGVKVGEGSFIGAGAIIAENSSIPAGKFVKAGTVWAKHRTA